MPTLRTIEITGNPTERGQQYGQQAADLIERARAHYGEVFEREAGMAWPEVREYVMQWQPLLDRLAPTLVEELRGIADGAGQDYRDLLALNVRGEFVYDIVAKRKAAAEAAQLAADAAEPEADGCTSYAITASASGSGHTYAGQNWDWRTLTGDTTLVVRIVQDPLPTIVMQVEAGQIGRHGANSAGISLNANGLGGSFDSAIGMPQTFIRRMVLDCAQLGDALNTLVRTKPHIASNALLVHRSGFMVDIETTPHGVGWVMAENDRIVHANHYQGQIPPELAGRYRPGSPDSFLRLPRAQAGIAAVAEATSHEDAVARIRLAMSDHVGYPDSVCGHPDPREQPMQQWSTLLSSCVDLTSGEYRIAAGNPCTNGYQLLPWNIYDGPGPTLTAPEFDATA